MLNRFGSIVLVSALICTIGGSSVLAQTPTGAAPVANSAETPREVPAPAKPETQPNEKLKAGLAKLLADTKAGKGKLSTQQQTQTAGRNNLSKRTKIALGVGIAVAVVLVIIIVHEVRDLGNFDFHGIAIR